MHLVEKLGGFIVFCICVCICICICISLYLVENLGGFFVSYFFAFDNTLYIYTELSQVIIHTAVSTMLALIWSIQLVSGTICILLSLTVVPQSSNKNFKVRTIHAERESLDLQVGRMYQLYYCV